MNCVRILYDWEEEWGCKTWMIMFPRPWCWRTVIYDVWSITVLVYLPLRTTDGLLSLHYRPSGIFAVGDSCVMSDRSTDQVVEFFAVKFASSCGRSVDEKITVISGWARDDQCHRFYSGVIIAVRVYCAKLKLSWFYGYKDAVLSSFSRQSTWLTVNLAVTMV